MKVMFLGVVSCPAKDEAKSINTKVCIYLERVSRKEPVTKMTKNSNFPQIGK